MGYGVLRFGVSTLHKTAAVRSRGLGSRLSIVLPAAALEVGAPGAGSRSGSGESLCRVYGFKVSGMMFDMDLFWISVPPPSSSFSTNASDFGLVVWYVGASGFGLRTVFVFVVGRVPGSCTLFIGPSTTG